MGLPRVAGVTTFYTAGAIAPGDVVLDGAAARHGRVLRLEHGDAVHLTDGRGTLGSGILARIGKAEIVVTIARVRSIEKLPPLDLFVPVADRDRMLMLGEKAAELGVSGWYPVVFARSRSVASRGAGDGFENRLRSRMIAALEQSGGAWLPDLHAPVPLTDILDRDAPTRCVLDASGAPILGASVHTAAAAVIGPEGGFEPDELRALTTAGWRAVRLAGNTLRFETAGIAAAAVLRAMLDHASQRGQTHG